MRQRAIGSAGVAAWLLTAAPTIAGPRVDVRGSARFEVQATRDTGPGLPGQGELVLRGTLTDDAGEPLARERIQVGLEHVGYPRDPQVEDALRTSRPCDPANVSDRPATNEAAWVRTDEGGRFCLRMAVVMDRYVASLSFAGARLVDPARLDLRFDLSRRALTLRLEPEPRVISLDAPELLLDVIAETDEEGVARPAAGRRLSLGSDAAQALGEATTNAAGRATFRIATEALGPPGRGELRVSFVGDPDTSFAEHTVATLRRATVTLGAAAPGAAGVPEEGIPLLVEVAARRGSKATDLVGEGSVEARVGEVVVAAAPVEVGRARLTLVFPSPGVDVVDVRLRYVPASPWFDGRSETTVRVPVKSPSPLRRLPLLLAAVGVIAWLVVGRRTVRAAPASATPQPEERVASPGTAALEVVRTLPHPDRPRWVGVVRDAHDGAPIEGADVAIERASFTNHVSLARTATDRAGRFDLELDDVHPTDTLVVEGPLHSALRQRIPASGELAIAIVLRKRKIVERLVRWARARGGAFDATPEPTPSQVREAGRDDFATVRWADEVERAAFDDAVVDAKLEASIQALMPPSSDGPPAPPDPARRRR